MITLDYNGFQLQTGTIITDSWTLLSPPNYNVQVDQLAHADGGRIVQQFMASRTFTISGSMRGAASMADMQTQADLFKSMLSQPNGVLTYNIDGASIRKVYCTASQITIDNDQAKLTSKWSVQFESADGTIWDTTTTTLYSGSGSSSTASVPILVYGSYKCQPDIKVTLTGLTVGSGTQVTITNGTTLKGVTVSRTWSNNDVLEVDSLNKLIYVNNIAVDFTGQFPEFSPGSGSLRYIDNFSARSWQIVGTYTQRWI